MNEAPSVPIVALVTHVRHVPAIERERFATALHRASTVRAFTLETCHRVEAYLGNADDATRLAPALPEGARTLTGEQAVHHAMTVAVGRDSVVVGEDQILHQLEPRWTRPAPPARSTRCSSASSPLHSRWVVGPGRGARARDARLRMSLLRRSSARWARSGAATSSSSEPAGWGVWRHVLRSPPELPSLSRTDPPTAPRRSLPRPAPATRRSTPTPGSAGSPASSWPSQDRGRSGPPRSMHWPGARRSWSISPCRSPSPSRSRRSLVSAW